MRRWVVTYLAPSLDPERPDALERATITVKAHSAWKACFLAQRQTSVDARAIVATVERDPSSREAGSIT